MFSTGPARLGRVAAARAVTSARRAVAAGSSSCSRWRCSSLSSAAAAFGTVRAFILDRGFIGLPPVGATPSAPESGELVLIGWEQRDHARTDPGGFPRAPLVRAWVYADGRMIWSRGEGPLSRFPRARTSSPPATSSNDSRRRASSSCGRRSSDSSIAVAHSSRLCRPTTIPRPGPYRRLGSLRSGRIYGSCWGSVEVRDGDQLVRLQWRDIEQRGIRHQAFEGTIATPEQLSALRRVDALLTDPASVLPSSAWAVREVRAYVPSHYAVCIDTSPPKDASELLSLLPTRAADVLRDKSWTQLEEDVGAFATYCSKLTTEEAREVAGALSGLDPVPGYTSNVILAYRLDQEAHTWAGPSIRFEPLLPPRPVHALRQRMSIRAMTSEALQNGGTMHARHLVLAVLAAAVTVTSVASAAPRQRSSGWRST